MWNRRPPTMTPAASRRGAFTLVELLVVIGIIAILIAILLPALQRAKEKANTVKCASNARQLYMASVMFASDNRGHLPRPSIVGENRNVPLIAETTVWAQADTGVADLEVGVLWRYIQGEGTRKELLFCPSDRDERAHLGTLQTGGPERNMSYSFNAQILQGGDAGAWLIGLHGGPDRRVGIPLAKVRRSADVIMVYEEMAPNDGLCLNPHSNMDDLPTGRHASPRTLFATRQDTGGSRRAWEEYGLGNYCFFDGHVELIAPRRILYEYEPHNSTYGMPLIER